MSRTARDTFAALIAASMLVPGGAAAASGSPPPTVPAPADATGLAGLPAWDRVETPSTGRGDNQLYAVDALATDDVWAVGYSSEDLRDDPLVEHFDGDGWSIVETPDIGPSQRGAQLLAVDAVTTRDVWAVGGYGDTSSLIMHGEGGDWSLVPHPNPGPLQRLNGVAAAAPDDVWAVGYVSRSGVSRTHVLHWDGLQWSVVASPNGSAGFNELYAVDVVAPDDVWAVGEDGGRSLTLHWDGSVWSRVPSPSGPLTGVTALASDDVWAVGSDGNTLTEHWDGESWSVVDSPDIGLIARLYGVDAAGPDDVWAVGTSTATGTLALRWDGSEWAVEPSPRGAEPNALRGVSALDPDDAVLVGESDFGTLVEQWDGTSLTVQPSADRGVGTNELRGVHAAAPDDVWAVGRVDRETLTQHWDGSGFSVVPSPSRPRRDNVLEDVDGVSADDVWAVGHHADAEGLVSRTLALHWDGDSWQDMPTPQHGARNARAELLAVAAVAPDDVWAVGSKEADGRVRALTLHWDGDVWQKVSNGCGSGLTGITALGADDVWAAGGALSCHWNGKRWRAVAFGDPANPQDLLDMADLDGVAADDLWAVGSKFSQCGEGLCAGGEIQHYDGTGWTTVRVGTLIGPPTLDGVDAVAADDVWAVGFGGVSIWHFDGRAWREAPEPDLAAGGQADLRSVEASGPGDVWAVGPQLSGRPVGASLALHARAFDAGAVFGETQVSDAVVSWLGPERGSVETDPFGRFQIGGLAAGSYRLVITREGCEPGGRVVTVVAGTTVRTDLALRC